ncbi:MAG: hypothetical protein K6B75_06210, partial [Lachnospiraceae bacterium]|nr:hypothetical protein [Lachnospiraceae bacterium]
SAFNDCKDIIEDLMNELTTSPENLAASVKKLKDENREIKYKLSLAKEEILSVKLASLPKDGENVLIFENDVDQNASRKIINSLMNSHKGICGIFSESENGYSFIAGSKGVNCADFAAVLRKDYKAKCGGSPEMIQGTVSAKPEDLRAAADLFLKHVK